MDNKQSLTTQALYAQIKYLFRLINTSAQLGYGSVLSETYKLFGINVDNPHSKNISSFTLFELLSLCQTITIFVLGYPEISRVVGLIINNIESEIRVNKFKVKSESINLK